MQKLQTLISELTPHEQDALKDILTALKHAKSKHPNFVKTIPEMALVMNEEVGEVSQAILDNFYDTGHYENIAKEVAQVAAVAIRMLCSI